MPCLDQFFDSIERKNEDRKIKPNDLEYDLLDDYRSLSGVGAASLRTILKSSAQRKLILSAMFWYAFQMAVYFIAANLLIYVTFHEIGPGNPAYPGSNLSVVTANSTLPIHQHNHKKELFDMGFHVTPDWSHRPWWLKAGFVDLNVAFAQMLPPVVLLLSGATKRFVRYTAIIGIVNLCKGGIQLATILPPANHGAVCWTANFDAAELEMMRDAPFWKWFWRPWGAAHGCDDMLWSGHSAQSCIGWLFLNNCLIDMGCACWCRCLIVVYAVSYFWAVLACRMHYSIDVLVAILVAGALFTHTPFNCWIWKMLNILLRNPKDDQPVPMPLAKQEYTTDSSD